MNDDVKRMNSVRVVSINLSAATTIEEEEEVYFK
jgi:hypothetical protein